MPYLTDLADACRKSGLKVQEIPGWRERGHRSMSGVSAVVVHHTATARTAPGDYPSLRIVRDGRSDLPGPLSQVGLGRNGTVYVIAAGVAYHAGATWEAWQGNDYAIGIEAEHDGLSPWSDQQETAYATLCAALVLHYKIPPARVMGHKEVAKPRGRKPDPTFDMDSFRRLVTDEMDRLTTPPPPKPGRRDAVAQRVALTRLAQALKPGRLLNKVKAARNRLPKDEK